MRNPVWINRDDAKERGINEGDVIEVFNDRGSFIRPACLSRCIMQGVVVVPHGATLAIDQESGIDKAGSDNMLTGMSNNTSYGVDTWNSTLVDYRKYTGPIELLPDVEWAPLVPLADE